MTRLGTNGVECKTDLNKIDKRAVFFGGMYISYPFYLPNYHFVRFALVHFTPPHPTPKTATLFIFPSEKCPPHMDMNKTDKKVAVCAKDDVGRWRSSGLLWWLPFVLCIDVLIYTITSELMLITWCEYVYLIEGCGDFHLPSCTQTMKKLICIDLLIYYAHEVTNSYYKWFNCWTNIVNSLSEIW